MALINDTKCLVGYE